MANFEKFEPIFGEPDPDCANAGGGLVRQSLFHVYAPDSHHIKVHVTDFHWNSWEAVLSVSKVDDMRDTVGVGGSWSEFVDYLVASLKSENVKLVLGGSSGSNEFRSASLVSQRAKGLPRITIALKKIVDSDANEAMANLSLELFKAFKSLQHLQEHGGTPGLTKVISTEKENEEAMHGKLETKMDRENLQRTNSIDRASVLAQAASDGQDSPGKQAARDRRPPKATKRVPANLRARKRGALLQDSGEDRDD